ncbi:TPA: hypothetical protein ACH3X2_005227 [Trebouxia sp. C0005]
MPLSTWLAVLAEVKQQVAHAREESKANGSWVDLAEGTSASPSHKQVTQRWQQQQWQNAFQVLIFEAPPESVPAEEQDDLLFFVHLEAYQAEVPYLVRRKTKALPVDLQEGGDKAHQIDWKRSVLLNLVTQTTYSLTVSACQREHLQSIGGNQDLGKHVVQVSKAVYASTAKSQLNLNNKRANDATPTLTYPDISFAVENYEEAFESLLLTEPKQCYLVLLTATAGMTFRGKHSLLQAAAAEEPCQASALAADQQTLEGSSGKDAAKDKSSSSKPRRLTVFSGFVSYDQLEQNLLGNQKKGPRWLHRNVEGPHPVRMRGPGGLGFADVAVTCLPQAASDSQASAQTLAQQQPPLSPNLTWQELQGHSASPNSSPEQKKNKLLGSAFGAAANVLKAIGNPAKGSPAPTAAPMHDMRCALMNLSLPVEPLALLLLQ